MTLMKCAHLRVSNAAGVLIHNLRLFTVSGSAKIRESTSGASKSCAASQGFSLGHSLLPEN